MKKLLPILYMIENILKRFFSYSLQLTLVDYISMSESVLYLETTPINKMSCDALCVCFCYLLVPDY